MILCCKNRRLKVTFTALFVLALLFAGCATMKSPPNSVVVIEAASNPTTGFGWEITIAGTGRFELESRQSTSSGGRRIGSPQIETFTLRSVRAGDAVVILLYRRPWEGGERLVEHIFIFKINDDLQVELSSAQKTVFGGADEETLPHVSPPVIR